VLLDITEELFVSNGFSVFIKRVNQRHLVHRVLSIIEEALVKQQQQKKTWQAIYILLHSIPNISILIKLDL
jgi:hypothetical protein